jgi:hypothetical protein
MPLRPERADALAGGREFEHDVDGRIARIGIFGGEDIDSVGPGGRASDIIGLAALRASPAATSPAIMMAASSVRVG